MNSRRINPFMALVLCALLAFSVIQCGDDDDNPATSNTDNTDTTTTDTTGGSTSSEAIVADHLSVAAFDDLTNDDISAVQNGLNIFYGHTSHGSQIVTGLNMLHDDDPGLTLPSIHEMSDDLGHNGDTIWVPPTRIYLNANTDCNVVVWSWCGGCSDNTVDGINAYLNALSGLETDYPNVMFVYMTGHLDGTGTDGTLYACNIQIRAYCETNDKILFDFADIESYDPNGTYYPDETDACAWCTDWCSTHTCPTCSSCAHSHCFNCYLKGKAMWWLMAQMAS